MQQLLLYIICSIEFLIKIFINESIESLNINTWLLCQVKSCYFKWILKLIKRSPCDEQKNVQNDNASKYLFHFAHDITYRYALNLPLKSDKCAEEVAEHMLSVKKIKVKKEGITIIVAMAGQ